MGKRSESLWFKGLKWAEEKWRGTPEDANAIQLAAMANAPEFAQGVVDYFSHARRLAGLRFFTQWSARHGANGG